MEHTQFRQLSTTQGRWLSPDPYMGSMDLTNPQSLNRYAYVLNNPLIGLDPTGLDVASIRGFCPAEFENCEGGGGSGGEGGSGAGGGGNPCLGGEGTGCIPFPFPIPIPFPVNPGGGGGGGGAPAPSAPSSPPNINPSGNPPLSGETLGVPNSVHIPIPSVLQTLGLAPDDPACNFIPCGTGGDSLLNTTTAPVPVEWCLTHPKICTIGSDVATRIGTALLLLSLEGDNEASAKGVDAEKCYAQYERDLDVCRQNHKRSCYAQAAERYAACLKGKPLPPFNF